MRSSKLIFCIFLILNQIASAQVFKVDTIQFQGNKDKFINIVVLGDGYTVDEQPKFLMDATKMSDYLFSQAPWSNYKAYFNVFAIEVISPESGVRHPNNASDCSSANVPVSNPNTHLGVTFDYANIHRLVVPTKNGNIANVLASNFPNYDQVVILGNSPYYGGSGGAFATATNGPSSFEVAVHELGHSFAFLADEYYAGDVFANERVNMTKETDPAKVKWKNWMGFKNVGIHQYCCGGQSANWYRPHNDCKMRYLGRDFCSVCSESTVKRIQNLVGSTIIAYSPEAQQAVNICDQKVFHVSIIKPSPNTLKVTWELNGFKINSDADSTLIDTSLLNDIDNNLKVTVEDTTLLLRDKTHNTTFTQVWNITKNRETKIKSSDSNTFCKGDSIILSVPQATDYQWSDGTRKQEIVVYITGSYSVLSYDINGCASTSDTVMVVVNDLPDVSLSFANDTICLSELPLNLSGGLPLGGIYYGDGVENDVLLPEDVVPGLQQIIYTFTDGNNCTDSTSDDLFIDVCSSTELTEISSGIKIVPNPTSGKFTIIPKNNLISNSTIQIFDNKGQLIHEAKNLVDELDLTMHAIGTYFIKIVQDRKIIFKKLVISH